MYTAACFRLCVQFNSCFIYKLKYEVQTKKHHLYINTMCATEHWINLKMPNILHNTCDLCTLYNMCVLLKPLVVCVALHSNLIRKGKWRERDLLSFWSGHFHNLPVESCSDHICSTPHTLSSAPPALYLILSVQLYTCIKEITPDTSECFIFVDSLSSYHVICRVTKVNVKQKGIPSLDVRVCVCAFLFLFIVYRVLVLRGFCWYKETLVKDSARIRHIKENLSVEETSQKTHTWLKCVT